MLLSFNIPQYLSATKGTTGLTKSLLTLTREQRHLAMRVLISTQGMLFHVSRNFLVLIPRRTDCCAPGASGSMHGRHTAPIPVAQLVEAPG